MERVEREKKIEESRLEAIRIEEERKIQYETYVAQRNAEMESVRKEQEFRRLEYEARIQ